MNKIQVLFIEETGITFALSRRCFYEGKLYDELLWAEIMEQDNQFGLRWNDDFFNPIFAPDKTSLKQLVLADLLNHKPHNNGRAYDI